MKLKEYMSMKDIFAEIIRIYQSEGERGFYNMPGWCIYAKDETITVETECYVDAYPDYDDDDNEVFSDYIVENHLYMLYRDEMVEDVVMSCIDQKANVSYDEIMEALIYYDQNDSFMDLS